MPRVGRDFEIRLEHLLRQLGARQWEPGSGREDVGQQEVPWDSRDTAVGVPGDVLKARMESLVETEAQSPCCICSPPI